MHCCYIQAIYVEGKQHAIAVGITKMSTADMYEETKKILLLLLLLLVRLYLFYVVVFNLIRSILSQC